MMGLHRSNAVTHVPRRPACAASYVCALLLAALLPPSSSSAQAPLMSSRRTFFIPFTVDMTTQGQMQPREVQLFVSADEGKSWHFYQRQTPDAGRFIFNAGQDGVHWFAVHASERTPEPGSDPNFQPELKVAIDTVQPHLELSVDATPEGELQVNWNASDPTLDIVTFRLEYKSASSPLWQPINVYKPTMARNDFTGQHRWRPLQNAGAIQVRAEISDRCGNVTTASQEFAWNPPTASQVAEAPGIPTSQTPPTPFIAQTGPATATMSPVASSPSPSVTPVPNATPNAVWPSQPAATAPAPHQPSADVWTTPPPPRTETAPMPSQAPGPDGASNTETANVPPAYPSYPQTTHPDAPAVTALPGNIRDTNSRRFELDYVVETAVDVGLARVALWYTKDQGHSWTLYGEDTDQVSPFLVEMNEDGVFGFKIVAEAQHGVTSGAPKAGVPADIWIRIDATPPTGRISTARFGRGESLGALQIFWESHDDLPATGPVTLLYGETAQGPWRVIADGLQPQGQYDWRVGANVPAEIYLRLEVRDQAGNITSDTLRDPIASNGLAPQSAIRGMRPASTP